ncbi:MAG: YjjG family noncanonical pyrimidine nucleotidase [Bacteroidota bacterium]|jgi:putative hydrolase of the HAD superfamily
MMGTIKAVFFDLDHTLWDFEANSRQTISELYHRYGLETKGVVNVSDFIRVYERINHDMWEAYSKGMIAKEHLRKGRFAHTLDHFGIHDDELAECLAEYYVMESPVKTHLFPFVHEILGYLSDRVPMALITNGFHEVQRVKVRESRLDHYFDHVLISEQIGFKKPHQAIFLHAASLCAVPVDQCLMVGDNLDTDIAGALDAGMQACLFDPNGIHEPNARYSKVACLSELQGFL